MELYERQVYVEGGRICPLDGMKRGALNWYRYWEGLKIKVLGITCNCDFETDGICVYNKDTQPKCFTVTVGLMCDAEIEYAQGDVLKFFKGYYGYGDSPNAKWLVIDY